MIVRSSVGSCDKTAAMILRHTKVSLRPSRAASGKSADPCGRKTDRASDKRGVSGIGSCYVGCGGEPQVIGLPHPKHHPSSCERRAGRTSHALSSWGIIPRGKGKYTPFLPFCESLGIFPHSAEKIRAFFGVLYRDPAVAGARRPRRTAPGRPPWCCRSPPTGARRRTGAGARW